MNGIITYRANTNLIKQLLLFVSFMVFSFSGFAQSKVSSVSGFEVKVEPTTKVQLEQSRATSNVEFALWFMGTKQDPNTDFSVEGTNVKKTIITSGMAPNRLLIKALLKKVVNYENSMS